LLAPRILRPLAAADVIEVVGILGCSCPPIWGYSGQWRPRALDPALFNFERIGAWHGICRANIIAFAMGLHRRLGVNASHYDLSPELLYDMFPEVQISPRGTSKSFRALLGLDCTHAM